MINEPCYHSATELAQLIRRKEISAVEVLEYHLQQIEALAGITLRVKQWNFDDFGNFPQLERAHQKRKKTRKPLEANGDSAPLDREEPEQSGWVKGKKKKKK